MINLKYYHEYKDMYNIYNLITKIDKGYKLYFCEVKKIFIVVNSAKNNQICLKTSKLSPNVLKILKTTRIENLNKIIKNIDQENEKLGQKNKENLVENLSTKMRDVLSLSKRVSDISNAYIQKIIGE